MLPNLQAKAQAIVEQFTARGEMIALAESCTGGLVCSLITSIAGASAVLERGLITYSNQSKMDLLGVSADILESHGAVSAECAESMVRGLLANAPAVQAGVAITGIAGPTGGTPVKPIGLVHVAVFRRRGDVKMTQHFFGGDREAIQHLAADATMNALLSLAV